MLDPIMANVQRQLYQSIISKLEALLNSSSSQTGYISDDPGWTPRATEFDDILQETADRYSLDFNLLKAVAHAESNFSADAVSHMGAKGVMQLMDNTAAELGVGNAFDPEQNIDGGARYLRSMLNRYQGDEVKALAAYNAGPGAVDQWGGLPPYTETQAYVPRILGLREKYQEWSV